MWHEADGLMNKHNLMVKYSFSGSAFPLAQRHPRQSRQWGVITHLSHVPPSLFSILKMKKKTKIRTLLNCVRAFFIFICSFPARRIYTNDCFFFLFRFRWICHSSCRDMQSATGIIPFLGIYLMGKLFRCCHVYHPGPGRQFIRPCYHKLWEKKDNNELFNLWNAIRTKQRCSSICAAKFQPKIGRYDVSRKKESTQMRWVDKSIHFLQASSMKLVIDILMKKYW